ncbi:MAG: type IX secretion system membrane protein PorP/SprF [Bacteroidales bacterium]|nr:type IX secretion system membrane protein PorP/SprF [Bacteroidales bacterium]
MKKVILVSLVFWTLLAFGQKEPMHTHYTYNIMAVNPAYAGLENLITATILHRSQWAAFPGAPRFQTASVHAPFGKNVGLGMSFVNEQVGPERNVALKADYSYTIRSEEKVKVVFGVKAALNMMHINLQDLELDDPNDDAFLNNKQSILLPNFGFGIIAYTKDYYVGFSIPDLIVHNYLNNTIFSSSNLLLSSKHYYIIGGALFEINHLIDFKPSAYIRISRSINPDQLIDIEADLTLIAVYNHNIHGGFSLRTGNSIAALFGLKIFPDIELGYSFDLLYTNKLQKYNGGSHELVLKYDLFVKKKIRPLPCPVFQI